MGFLLMLDKFESFVGVNFWTMIFAWINLLILYLFLKKLLFKPVKNMIDSRQKEIDDMYSDAEKSQSDAALMKSEYEAKLEAANEESEEILKEANVKAARTLERASEQVELEKKRAINEVKDEVSEMAISIATAVIERDIKAEEHKELMI